MTEQDPRYYIDTAAIQSICVIKREMKGNGLSLAWKEISLLNKGPAGGEGRSLLMREVPGCWGVTRKVLAMILV